MKKGLFITLAAVGLSFLASSCVKEKGFEDRVRNIVAAQLDSLNRQVVVLEKTQVALNDSLKHVTGNTDELSNTSKSLTDSISVVKDTLAVQKEWTTEQLDAIGVRVKAIEEAQKVFMMEIYKRLGLLWNRIQKIDVVPDYGDGSVKLNGGKNLIRFAISPDSLAPKLATAFATNKTKFTFLMVQTLTKAATYDTLDVDTVAFIGNGTLGVTVNGEKIPSYYYAEDGKTGNGCLKISDTVNCFTSGYFSLTRIAYPELKNALCITINGVNWAPVNCGYIKNSYPYGKLYQWGRKDGCGYKATDETSSYNDKDDLLQTTADGPVSASSVNINSFYIVRHTPGDWLESPNDFRWNSSTESSPVKTSYDPCPSGWRVPTLAELTSLFGSCKGGELQDGTGVHSGMKGRWLDGSTASEPFSGVFFPAAGYRDSYFGDAECRGSEGRYWSSSIRFAGFCSFDLYVRSDNVSITYDYRAEGYSVRCVKE